MPGLFLALEGIDGAGKSSQIELLADYFQKQGKRIRTPHFPRTGEKPYGELIAEFLRGEFGAADAVHPRLTALLYALDRMEAGKTIREWLLDGDVVIADRYVHSNIAYQCAKLSSPEDKARLADWIERLEYGHHAIPRPHLSVFLDVPPDFALKNMQADAARESRAYLHGKKDIHEENSPLQERVRREFAALARDRTKNLAAVDCSAIGGGMADVQTIHARVVDALRYYGIVTR